MFCHIHLLYIERASQELIRVGACHCQCDGGNGIRHCVQCLHRSLCGCRWKLVRGVLWWLSQHLGHYLSHKPHLLILWPRVACVKGRNSLVWGLLFSCIQQEVNVEMETHFSDYLDCALFLLVWNWGFHESSTYLLPPESHSLQPPSIPEICFVLRILFLNDLLSLKRKCKIC